METIDDKTPEPAKTLSIALTPNAAYNVPSGPLRLQITDNDTPPNGDGKGLKGDYFSDAEFQNLVTTKTDGDIDFDWNKSAPVKGVDAASPYSIRWTGQIQPLFSGTYTFMVNGTKYGSQTLWIDGKQLLATKEKNAARHATVELKAGQKYPIKLEFTNDKSYGSKVSFLWSSDSQFEQIVPKSQLFPAP